MQMLNRSQYVRVSASFHRLSLGVCPVLFMITDMFQGLLMTLSLSVLFLGVLSQDKQTKNQRHHHCVQQSTAQLYRVIQDTD